MAKIVAKYNGLGLFILGIMPQRPDKGKARPRGWVNWRFMGFPLPPLIWNRHFFEDNFLDLIATNGGIFNYAGVVVVSMYLSFRLNIY